jgi:sugar lactone lactonase YvrE
MAGRKFVSSFFHYVARPVVVMLCTALCLAAGSVAGLHHVTAQKESRAPLSAAPAMASGAVAANSAQELSSGVSGGTAIGEFTGSLDVNSGQLKLTSSAPSRGRYSLQSRSDVNSVLPPGSFTIRLTDTNGAAADSVFLSGSGIVSGEIEIVNNTATTFYNTRLVFTSFRISNASGAAASNSPSTGGLAFYNDGQVAYNNQLNVSRSYGDIAAGGSGKAIWTFAVPTSGPTFYFQFQVLADLGVAAESVEPAAVQVSGSAGSSVNINGRGFVTTPTVQLLNSSGSVVTTLQVNSVSSTQLNVTIPAGTAAGIYGLRVINPGGTAGGIGSSALNGRLTVTGQPTTTLSGLISSLSGPGPYLVNGSLVFGADVNIPAGTVFYFASGATLQLASSGNLTANGGIPGIPNTAPGQIVFTAQRSPGQGIPSPGAWNGIDATSAAAGNLMTMRNCVVEYGGLSGGAQIRLAGSGRRLRFTDSISRRSAGTGIDASGPSDSLEGFARSRLDNNGTAGGDVAVLLSGNSALGLYDLDGTTSGTSVADANYYYASANSFNGNTGNFIQIGTDASAASNDFTRSGVLVGQGETPIHLRGSSSNPAIVGGNTLVELSINAGATIKLAPGTDLQAGDSAQNLYGGISANGLAGVTQVPGAAFGSSQYIIFDKIGGTPSAADPGNGVAATGANGNWGAVFFSRNAPASSILNYVSLRNGGSSVLGDAAVLAEGVVVQVTNSEIVNSETGSVLAYAGGNIITSSATFGSTNAPLIDSIAGGLLGDGNPASQAHLGQPTAIAADPLGRGVFVADYASSLTYIRFINTTNAPLLIAGQRVASRTIQTIAGRENGDISENVPGLTADLGSISGLAVSPDGNLLYFTNTVDNIIRALNLSGGTLTVAGGAVASGNVRTVADASVGFSSVMSDITTAPNGDLLVVDSDSSINKVYRIAISTRTSPSQAATVIAGRDKVGNEKNDAGNPPFSPGPATSLLLFQPRAVETDTAGNFYVTDTGHGRVIKIDSAGNATLVTQFSPGASGPYPSSLAVYNGNVYVANGNQQVVARLTGGGPAIVAGIGSFGAGQGGAITGTGTFCDYSSSNCGDGGVGTSAGFQFPGTSASTGISADSKGIYVLDQTVISKGRIRYLNLSGSAVTLAGVTVAPNAVNTIAGTGLPVPYDNGLATSASLNTPTGVAVDASNNIWFSDTQNNHLRYFNRGTTTVTLFAGTAAQKVVPPGYIVTIDDDNSTGDNCPVNQATFSRPQGLTITAQGVFVADSTRGQAVPAQLSGRRTGLLRYINTTSQPVTFYPNTAVSITVPPGNIATIVGGGTSIEDLEATNTNINNAVLVDPTDVVVNDNFIYVTDAGNDTVRKISRATGLVVTLTSNNVPQGQRLATAKYTGLAFDASGRLYLVNTTAGQILRETSAGSGSFAVMNTTALNKPKDVAIDPAGNAYVTNAGTSQIAKVSSNGAVTMVAGISTPPTGLGFFNYGGDQGDARNARLNINPADFNAKVSSTSTPQNVPQTVGIALSASGEIIFTDTNNNRIRRIR